MLFLYNMPTPLMGALIVGLTLVIVLVGYAVARRLNLLELDAEQRGMALSMVSVITTINSLLVAFAAINVWDDYNRADLTVMDEASCARELARDLAAFRSPPADLANQALRAYLVSVVQTEWPAMQQHASAADETQQRFDTMFDAANHIQPLDARQTALLSEVLARSNEMVKHRHRRLSELKVVMPATLWAVILIVSAMSFALMYVLPATPFHVTLIGSWAVTLGLTLFFVLAVDRPFVGEVSVSAEPFVETIASLAKSNIWPIASPN